MGRIARARRRQEQEHPVSPAFGAVDSALDLPDSQLHESQPATGSKAGHRFGAVPVTPTSVRPVPLVQGKLEVSQPSDPQELEADLIADEIVQTDEPADSTAQESEKKDRLSQRVAPAHASRQSAPRFVGANAGADEGVTDMESVVASTVSTGGEPLSSGTRRYMEPRFGHDFNQVRVHADEAAFRSAHAVQAHAYTVGNDIVFGPGKYAPGTRDGDRLLAHELAHVVQQTGGGAPRQLSDSRPALQRQSAGATAPRLPVVSAASAIPAQIKAVQAAFHARMQEAVDIVEGTNFHYNYVNGIYAACYGIQQVVLGQAAEQKIESQKIAEGLLAGVELVVMVFAPEGEAVGAVGRILQIGEKVHKAALKVEKTVSILEAIEAGAGGKEKKEEGEGSPAPAAPSEFRILGLEHVVSLALAVANVHNCGDRVLDGAVDLSTQIAADAPDSGALTAEQTAALDEALASSQQVLTETEPLLASLRTLRDRRKVPIPSWAETEQDIWILYFSSIGRCLMEPVIENHMVDLGLWGRRGGPPGGRLGVSEEEALGGAQVFEGTKTVPGKEDEETQRSTAPQTITQMQAIQAEAAQLPAKWRRIMLLTD
jgi:hypothetical protein